MLTHHPSLSPVPLDHWAADPVPLVFDLDGTLITEDSSRHIWRAAWKRAGGKAQPRICGLSRDAIALSLKDWSLRSVDDLNGALSNVVYRDSIVEHAQAAQYAGRRLWLVSGSMRPAAQHLAKRLYDHAGLEFEQVHGSTWPTNLIRYRKADFLAESLPHGFDYVGDNPSQDGPVWAKARCAYRVL